MQPASPRTEAPTPPARRARLARALIPASLMLSQARAGRADRVALLLRLGFDPDEPLGPLSERLAHCAARAGAGRSGPIVRAAAAAGADLDALDQAGLTPLAHALMINDPEAAKELLAAGANPRGALGQSRPPLADAIELCPGALEALLAAGAHADEDGCGGLTPLDLAFDKRPGAIATLLAWGADPTAIPEAESMLDVMRAGSALSDAARRGESVEAVRAEERKRRELSNRAPLSQEGFNRVCRAMGDDDLMGALAALVAWRLARDLRAGLPDAPRAPRRSRAL